jgi:hypothetical protein
MVYQAPQEQCLPNWPKISGFELGKMHLPGVPLLILENLPNHPHLAGWTLRHAKD